MRIPNSIKPPYRHDNGDMLTNAFWNEIRDSAFSLAGVIYLMGDKAGITIESECIKMRKDSLNDGADQEYCDIFSAVYRAFYREGLASAKTATLSPPGQFTTKPEEEKPT